MTRCPICNTSYLIKPTRCRKCLYSFSDNSHPVSQSNLQRWDADKDVTHCSGCQKAFSTFFRRHHCRLCGKIFCNNCSRERMRIAGNLVRVCNVCSLNQKDLIRYQHSRSSYISSQSSQLPTSPRDYEQTSAVPVTSLSGQPYSPTRVVKPHKFGVVIGAGGEGTVYRKFDTEGDFVYKVLFDKELDPWQEVSRTADVWNYLYTYMYGGRYSQYAKASGFFDPELDKFVFKHPYIPGTSSMGGTPSKLDLELRKLGYILVDNQPGNYVTHRNGDQLPIDLSDIVQMKDFDSQQIDPSFEGSRRRASDASKEYWKKKYGIRKK